MQLALTPLLRQRTPKGQRRIHEWLGVRNYLRDFSQLADAPAGHLVLWERYLVYAVALGVSDDLAHGLAARIPPRQSPSASRPGTSASAATGPGYGSIGHFSDELRVERGRLVRPAVELGERTAAAAASPAAAAAGAAEAASAPGEPARGAAAVRERIDMAAWLSGSRTTP